MQKTTAAVRTGNGGTGINRLCRENPLNEKSEQCVKFALHLKINTSESTGEYCREKLVLGCVFSDQKNTLPEQGIFFYSMEVITS